MRGPGHGRRLRGRAPSPGPRFPAVPRGSPRSGLAAAALQASAPGAQVSVGPGRRDGPRGGCARGIWPSLVARRVPGRDRRGTVSLGGRMEAPPWRARRTPFGPPGCRAEGCAGEEWWHLFSEGGGGGASYVSGQVSQERLREGVGPLHRGSGRCRRTHPRLLRGVRMQAPCDVRAGPWGGGLRAWAAGPPQAPQGPWLFLLPPPPPRSQVPP